MTPITPDSDVSIRDHLQQLEARIDDLESENDALRETVSEQSDQIEDQQQQIEALQEENARLDAVAQAALKKAGANKDRIAELQTRELEKGAHLLADHVDPDALADGVERLERFTKEDDTYMRIPDSDDPLDRGGSVTLSHGDLLPIQQLVQMDDDMLRSSTNSLPSRLAVKLWRARSDPSVGDDPWQEGCKGVREYVKASDMKHWIRRQETGVSDAYAKKLVSRMIDALLELSENRLAIRKRTERKNGLPYTERRVLLKADASIPGATAASTGSPETAGVHGYD
ncbi:hypothetical protein [Natrinema halophilum]|uniref:Uncharacterized protein n=1 Tax=Natrinema halophilum TaxID=1699371 RepID=A0A7D5GIY0_9EURY|nr:hypothetical protein [Natrinema halophilum]QLG50248.1 hypothetical protein HYG82_16035 [Natrinema halophilum]